ncbi:ABC transporter permease [Clostridium sp. ATCC 25772]|uniref:ABC transporter permease n=1 Tax=Clostridium sp. ATCC 25772 TaxID=1676991 RepID=UPI0007838C0F|nr:ABC transporter permease [Clostridium sp. ATCC 25772]
MYNLVKSELRKVLLKKRVFLVWILGALLCSVLVRFDSSYPNYILENYASVFDKTYGIAPIMGMLILIITSSMYNVEYNSYMTDLINSSKNGKKKVVMAKSIAGSIATSIVLLSLYLIIVFSAIHYSGAEGLNLQLKELWYFGNSGSTITVLQMIIILGITMVMGCIFFTQITLLLSSISNNAVMPFMVSGLFMGIPYIAANFLPAQIQKYAGLTPLWAMYSSTFIRYKTPMFIAGIDLLMFILVLIIVPKITYKNFVSEKR